MAERFYINSPLQPGPVALEGPEAHHLAVVSRLRAGDQAYLFNGDGRQYAALVESIQKKRVDLTVTRVETPERELGFHLQVAAPLPKADRATFLIEKLTELGVTSFVPLRTERSVVHPSENRLEKLQRTVIEASKQCGRNVLMKIAPLIDWQEYCGQSQLPANRLLAHPAVTGGEPVSMTSGAHDWVVAVGPEGGLTEQEVALARARGWRTVSLGARILRVETAALLMAALAIHPDGATKA